MEYKHVGNNNEKQRWDEKKGGKQKKKGREIAAIANDGQEFSGK